MAIQTDAEKALDDLGAEIQTLQTELDQANERADEFETERDGLEGEVCDLETRVSEEKQWRDDLAEKD